MIDQGLLRCSKGPHVPFVKNNYQKEKEEWHHVSQFELYVLQNNSKSIIVWISLILIKIVLVY